MSQCLNPTPRNPIKPNRQLKPETLKPELHNADKQPEKYIIMRRRHIFRSLYHRSGPRSLAQAPPIVQGPPTLNLPEVLWISAVVLRCTAYGSDAPDAPVIAKCSLSRQPPRGQGAIGAGPLYPAEGCRTYPRSPVTNVIGNCSLVGPYIPHNPGTRF